ncbi:MAG: magnesium transporter [Chitinivibrionales bacterium]|nr:magnesium transporter [Chitinivibrionales bacterium]
MINTRFLQTPLIEFLRKDIPVFEENTPVMDVMNQIRTMDLSDQIIYFYVVDSQHHLTGVLPLRKLITASTDQRINEIMVKSLVSLPETATIETAYQVFNRHKFLSLPVVSDIGKFLGVIDVTALTHQDFTIANKQRFDDVFETIGLRYTILKQTSAGASFRLRFPWLVPTLLSGTLCAILASFYKNTLEENIIIAFFLTLVLGLGESISIQSLSITVKRLHGETPTLKWYIHALKNEFFTALYLGCGLATCIGIVVFLWKGNLITAGVLSLSILLSVFCACIIGLSAPTIIHMLKVDPKVAAGPLALGIADLSTVILYFSLASWLL